MGCGASSVYQEDGAVKQGAGEVRMEYDADAPIQVMFFWPDGGNDIAVEVKKIIAGPEGAKQKWEKVADIKNGETTAWVSLPPGDYFHRFVVDNLRTLYPKQAPLDLCKKIHVIHKKDEEKYPKQLKKGVEKEKEHPYNVDGGDDLTKKDMDSLENFVSPHQCDDRMNKFKDALTGMEDNLPGNKFSTSVSFKHDLGHWDNNKEKPEELNRVLALPDKVREKAEAEVKKPVNARKLNVKAGEVMRTGITKAIEGLCKGLGATMDELMPTLPDLLDAADGRRPGGTAKPDADPPKEGAKEEKKEEKKETKEEEEARVKAEEEARLAFQKKWYAFDASKKSEWEAADSKSVEEQKNAREKAHVGAFESLKGVLEKPLDSFDSTNGTPCIAFYKGKAYAEGRALSSGSDGVTVHFDENLLEFADVDTVKAKAEITVKKNGKDEKVEVNGVAAMPPPADFDSITLGQVLRCRGEKNDFFNGTVLDKDDSAKTVTVEDKYYQKFTLKSDAVFTQTTLPSFSLPVVLRPNFLPCEFWWVCEEDEVARKLHIWREGDKDGSLQTINLEKRRAPLKATKKEPNPSGDVFVGYSAKVKLLPERNYCYVFEVADQFFVDWKKQVQTKDAHRRFRAVL
jgi:hypothetical protein